ncbi:hypothetical protein EJ04DRAFT_101750 [Polyplosphaeria fusca]|uniref:Uncharacterized protein n=1 Tax=Polyplosphaeria fusca TaxID=682080 RepID=A0A9P4QJC5_9PLEO|nr:hypothetical protein EJ04DRAFT_101750 [Polyplosphaeria fusca]
MPDFGGQVVRGCGLRSYHTMGLCAGQPNFSPCPLVLRPTRPCMLLLLTFIAFSRVATALDDKRYALVQAPVGQYARTSHPGFHTVFLILGGYVILLSSRSLGPLMGITSVLWVMMRNDNAVSPKFVVDGFRGLVFFDLCRLPGHVSAEIRAKKSLDLVA